MKNGNYAEPVNAATRLSNSSSFFQEGFQQFKLVCGSVKIVQVIFCPVIDVVVQIIREKTKGLHVDNKLACINDMFLFNSC